MHDNLIKCTKCKMVKAPSSFPADRRKANGRCSHCLDCRSADTRARYARTKDRLLAKKAAKRLANIGAARKKDAEERIARKPARQAANKRRYAADPAKAAAVLRAWEIANPIRARKAGRIAKKAWRTRNPERAHESDVMAYAKRRARKLGGEFEPITLSDIIKRDGPCCYICGIVTDPDVPAHSENKAELEHVVPLSKGGHHIADNLRCACFRCNRTKGHTRTPEEVRSIIRNRPSHALVLIGAS